MKSERQIVYTIRANENYGGRRSIGRYTKKSEARRELNKLLSKPKSRMVNGRKIYLTSYRNALSGTGVNNPRIKKILGFK